MAVKEEPQTSPPVKMDDQLGILSKAQFTADVDSLARRARPSHPLGLLVIDLDHFKTVNDTHGHEAGDEVLKGTADVMQLICEGKGSCYRYGGDELTVLLPNHSIQEAIAVAERMRLGISQLKFELCPEKMTASIGVASCPDSTKDPRQVFPDADAMMYKAKESGGNNVQGATASAEMNLDSTAVFRLDIASRVETVELWMKLDTAYSRNYSAIVTNDSDEEVTVEAITLKRDKVYLSEPSKPTPSDDWKIAAHHAKTIRWEPRTDPVSRLRLKEPHLRDGEIIEIDLVIRGRVLGRLRTFTHTILASANYSNYRLTEF